MPFTSTCFAVPADSRLCRNGQHRVSHDRRCKNRERQHHSSWHRCSLHRCLRRRGTVACTAALCRSWKISSHRRQRPHVARKSKTCWQCQIYPSIRKALNRNHVHCLPTLGSRIARQDAQTQIRTTWARRRSRRPRRTQRHSAFDHSPSIMRHGATRHLRVQYHPPIVPQL
jgi:hypothetical protein